MTRAGKPLALMDADGTVLFRFLAREVRQEHGKVKALRTGASMMKLDEDAGEIAVWTAAGKKVATITSEGYRSANVICGISVRTPPFLEIPGEGRVPNPHIVIDEKTGAFRAGYWRKIALAPNLTGNPVMVDRCTYLDLHSYLMEDLLNLRHRSPHAVMVGVSDLSPATRVERFIKKHNGQLMEKIEDWESKNQGRKSYMRDQLVTGAEMEEAIDNAREGIWRFMELEPVTGWGIWINPEAEAVARVFRTYAQTQKFGSRRLEAISFRNVMREHPLAPKMKIPTKFLEGGNERWEGEGKARKKIVDPHGAFVRCFFAEFLQDPDDIEDLMDQFAAGVRLAGLIVDADAVPQRADADALKGETTSDRQDEKPQPSDDPEQEPVEDDDKEASDPRSKLFSNIRDLEDLLGDDKAAEIRKNFPFMGEPLTASAEQLQSYLNAINLALDREIDDSQS